jgi:DTW domain-containing protein YfiP
MELLSPVAAGRCYGCFRPREDCFCAAIPAIDNRTHVLILQHKRERFHRFGTARIVERALKNSALEVGLDGRFAAGLSFRTGAGLLYPGPDSEPLEALPPERRPRQLVVLDGTWHHAKTMFRDLPQLRALPRYRLSPTEPSRYAFRREPHEQFISTVEATIAALRILEPELAGLDALRDAFLAMVTRQLDRSKDHYGARRRKRPRQTIRNVPVAVANHFENIVVAYGESMPAEKTRRGGDTERGRVFESAPSPCLPCAHSGSPAMPAYWVAERLGTGELFSARIAPPVPPDDGLLGHWELTAADFAVALSPAEAAAAWKAFARPTDVLTVFNQGAARLAQTLAPASCLVLKSVDLHPDRRYATLEELLVTEQIPVPPALHPGRAGRRLANLAAYVRHLHALAIQRA